MLYIRTDMNNKIATGHMMRCLSVADAARSRGEDVAFITSDFQGVDLLKQRGYVYYVTGTKWDDMESELPFMKKLGREKHIKKILIDSYQVTYDYLKQMTEITETYYIDDLNAFLYPVNGIICYANYWEKFNYPERYSKTKLYLGPKYAPLREEFCHCEKKEISLQVENLLLMSGGLDPYRILPQMLEKMDLALYHRIDVICGLYNTDCDNLKKKYRTYKNVHIHKGVTDIGMYMKKADLAVSAGGTALYELCAAGTPAISYSLADNQLDNVSKFQEDELIDYAGDIRKEDVVSNIVSFLKKNRENKKQRMERSRRMQEMVDGKGAARIADLLKTN